MHKEESQTDMGTISIHNNVIASVASIASLETNGVKGIGKDLTSSLLEFVGKPSFGIKVDIDKSGRVTVHIPLVVKYGYNIPEVASKVQEHVRNALEKMTDISIKDINITIRGIEKG